MGVSYLHVKTETVFLKELFKQDFTVSFALLIPREAGNENWRSLFKGGGLTKWERTPLIEVYRPTNIIGYRITTD